MLADAEDRITINRRAGELTISFSGDTNRAGQFAPVPDFVLKPPTRSRSISMRSNRRWVSRSSARARGGSASSSADHRPGVPCLQAKVPTDYPCLVPNHSPSMVGFVDTRRDSSIRRPPCPPTDVDTQGKRRRPAITVTARTRHRAPSGNRKCPWDLIRPPCSRGLDRYPAPVGHGRISSDPRTACSPSFAAMPPSPLS